MTRYTVTGRDGQVLGHGYTAQDAMAEILNYDGYRYEIRRSEFQGSTCWEMWHSDASENSMRGARHMVKSVVFSFTEDEAAATLDIAEKVIAAGWSGRPTAVTDEQWAEWDEQARKDAADDDE